MKPTLVLWDIDGTLLRGGGVGKRAMEAAFREVLALEAAFDMSPIPFHGNTDPLIVAAGLALLGQASDDRSVSERVVRSYFAWLEAEVARVNPFVRLPGVSEVVEALAPWAHQGLGTGNIEDAAWLKVSSVALRDRFSYGGFGSDAGDRGELLRIGRGRGAAQLGVAPEACRVIVIGDTLRDVAAARAIGADVIAVATGGTPFAELRDAAPDLALETLDGAYEVVSRFVRGDATAS